MPGMNTDDWNPATNGNLPGNFDCHNLGGKEWCKECLQRELELPIRPDVPMLGFIGRLDSQKGADLILEVVLLSCSCSPSCSLVPAIRRLSCTLHVQVMPWLIEMDIQFVMLGTGRKDIEEAFFGLQQAHRDKVRCWIGFDVPFSHRLTAGCDIFLMPSRFEPCGLNQMYSMRYGTVPVVHRVGGLKDTVRDFTPFEVGGTGWTFSPFSADNFKTAIWYALDTYWNHRDSFRKVSRSVRPTASCYACLESELISVA
eukprot:scaffold1086_cov397-Prasinococcus_capsulatus_cf.AAC.17